MAIVRRVPHSLWLITAAITLLVLSMAPSPRLGAQDGATPGVDLASPSPSADAALLEVTGVEVLFLESFPVQVRAVVTGYFPDSCTELGTITQQRDGSTIRVTITVTRPVDAVCAQVITEVEEIVPLDGDFPSGEYTLLVNAQTTTFTV